MSMHKNHEMKMKHGEHRSKHAAGGIAGGKSESQEETNKDKTEKMKLGNVEEAKDEANHKIKVAKKEGGRIKRKSGGHVPGHKTMHRLDKKARGGAAKDPLSGASAENLSYAHGNLKAGSEGMGKDRT